MSQKDVGNKIPIYKLKTTDEVMRYYDDWGIENKYDKDMEDWNYTGPKETSKIFDKYSKNKNNAISLLEFLTTPEAQKLYSSINYEYPVNPTMTLSNELKSWGEFKEDKLPIEKLAELAPIAQKVIDRVGW